jgi:hypothetical protein
MSWHPYCGALQCSSWAFANLELFLSKSLIHGHRRKPSCNGDEEFASIL